MKKTLSTKNKQIDLSPADRSKKIREFFSEPEQNIYNPDELFNKLFDGMDARRKDKLTDEETSELYKLGKKVIFTLGLETHLPVAESVDLKYRYFVTEMIRRTEQEYGCKTAIEKSLAEMIGLAHVRVLTLSRTMSSYSSGEVSINRDINDYYRIIGKELDRAQRQLTSAILTLRQIKMPHTSFNINAKTAFIANNQQINES